jgi:hypothetical protein
MRPEFILGNGGSESADCIIRILHRSLNKVMTRVFACLRYMLDGRMMHR